MSMLTIRTTLATALDARHGTRWQTGETLAALSRLARDLDADLRARGLGTCIACDRITAARWRARSSGEVPMCQPCQDRNPAIQQMKAADDDPQEESRV